MKVSISLIFSQASSALLTALMVFLSVLASKSAYAETTAMIGIPPLRVVCGQPFQPPIIIDRVENLAGVKLVIKYDASLLTYETAEKGNATASFMHVVNDKKPGELVIVMAGAKCISGKDLTLITLRFAAKTEPPTNPAGNPVRIMEAELMNDQLKYVKVEIQEKP